MIKKLLRLMILTLMLISLLATVVNASETPVNLWTVADNGAIVYIDGTQVAEVTNYKEVEKYSVQVSQTPLVAAKAWDTSGKSNIAGFKLVLLLSENNYLTTGSNWYYYHKLDDKRVDIPPTVDVNGKQWFEAGYISNEWLPVTSFTLEEAPLPRQWAVDKSFPNSLGLWIWSPNFNYPDVEWIDTPVYLRSERPDEPKTYYTIKTNVVGSGVATINGSTEIVVEAGSALTTYIEAGSGYVFSGWDVTPPTTATASATYTATFIPSESELYNISTSVIGSGTASVNGGTSINVPQGTSLSFVATPGSGYYFSGWDKILPSTAQTTAVYTAVFKVNPVVVENFILDVSATEGGTVPAYLGKNTFSSGTNVYLNPVANEGYTFEGWLGDEVNNGVIIMNSDKEVTAIFQPEVPQALPAQIVIDVVGEGNIVSGTYLDLVLGSTFDLGKITPADGWKLISVGGANGGEVIIDGDGNYSILMNEDKRVEIRFEKIVTEVVGTEEDEETFIDGSLPEAGLDDSILPKTSGVPIEVISYFGTGLVGLGLVLRKRK